MAVGVAAVSAVAADVAGKPCPISRSVANGALGLSSTRRPNRRETSAAGFRPLARARSACGNATLLTLPSAPRGVLERDASAANGRCPTGRLVAARLPAATGRSRRLTVRRV